MDITWNVPLASAVRGKLFATSGACTSDCVSRQRFTLGTQSFGRNSSKSITADSSHVWEKLSCRNRGIPR
ncbi:MAG: hypothetical protein ACTS6H_01345 [Candidatus Hodgkinia cicadicola]